MSAIHLDNDPAASLIEDLPGIMEQIAANWPILPSGIWNSSSVPKLSRELQRLLRRSELAGAMTLHGLITEIDEAINGIIDGDASPDDNQIDALNRLLTQLRAMTGAHTAASAPRTTKDPALRTPAIPFDLLYLSTSGAEADTIAQALKSRALHCQTLTEPDNLPVILSSVGARTLLVDASFLSSPALEPVLRLLKASRTSSPSLFVIADQSTMETRLVAMRAGAVHLFTRPIEAERLIDALQAHIHPVPKPRTRVLIVEDDESQAIFAAKLLQRGGHDALAVTDPLGVIDAVARFQPDLILMDLYMPGADGIELTRVIRDQWESSAIPVVFLSGEDDPEKKLLALQSGADDFLTKPVRPQQLLATVDTRIQRAQQIAKVAASLSLRSADEPANRRDLLQELDLTLAHNDATTGFLALLVIELGPETEAGAGADESGRGQVCTPKAAKAVRALLQDGDTLACLDGHRLGVLCRRSDELNLEYLATSVYENLSQTLETSGIGHIGLGMVLLNGAERNASLQLSRGEASAESACRHNRRGYVLFGEEPADPVETDNQLSADCDRLRMAIRAASLVFQKQGYNHLREQSLGTLELVPESLFPESGEDPYLTADHCALTTEFDRYVFHQALVELGQEVARGRTVRLIFRQSAAVVTEPDYAEFIRAELRRRQLVGTGLMVEFDLPSLAANLKHARQLIGELGGMGISVVLGNFACNETAFKVLAYLQAHAIRPHRSLLRVDGERITRIAQQLHSLQVEIILPRVARHGQIALPWSESADCVQADFAG